MASTQIDHPYLIGESAVDETTGRTIIVTGYMTVEGETYATYSGWETAGAVPLDCLSLVSRRCL